MIFCERVDLVAQTVAVEGGLGLDHADEQHFFARFDERLHRAIDRTEALLRKTVLAAVDAKAHEVAVLEDRVLLEDRGIFRARHRLHGGIDDGVADDEHTVGREALGEQKLAVDIDGRKMDASRGLARPRVELLGIRLQTAALPVFLVLEEPMPFWRREVCETGEQNVCAFCLSALRTSQLRRKKLPIVRCQRPYPRLHVDRCEAVAETRIARGHRGRGVAMHVRDDDLVALFEFAHHVAEPPDDLADDLVHRAADIEIEIRLDAELLEHPATEVLVVVLACVAEHGAVPALLELLVERHLLDDIGLGRDEDQVHVPVRVRRALAQKRR